MPSPGRPPSPGDGMADSPVVDFLTEHLKKCLVLIEGLDRGSGFFVAPGTIVTCAHVAGPPDTAVTVTWQGRSLPGTVRWGSDPGEPDGFTAYPDLAVVEVDLPDGGHQSVWLDDHRPASHTEFTVAGHARVYESAPVPISGRYAHRGEHDEMIRLTDDTIEPGMSGGPVLDERTGGVCGVTKASRKQGQPAAGGVAVPIRALREIMPPDRYRELRRAHDRYHRRNRGWILLADKLPDRDGAIPGWAERHLRLVLGTLPPAGHDRHLADYLAIGGDRAVLPMRHRLHDHGDVVTELAGLAPPDDGFPHVLAYLLRLARPAGPALADQLHSAALMAATSDEQRERVEAAMPASRSGGRPAPATGRSSVLVYVWPTGPNRQRYRCEIWRLDGDDRTALDTEQPDRSAEELRAHLREHLPQLIRKGGGEGRPPTIELVLPMELIDEAVERWPRAGRGSFSLLGSSYPVVVRELERFELDPSEPDDEEMLVNWERRWAALRGQAIGTEPAVVIPVACDEKRDEAALLAELDLHPGLGAVVLPDTPRGRAPLRSMLDVGIFAGVPIMVWRRNGCAGEDGTAHDGCAGAALAAAVGEVLAGVRRDDVPEQILLLRKQAAALRGPDCGNDVVLFWDDPGRRLARPPMTPPRGSAGG